MIADSQPTARATVRRTSRVVLCVVVASLLVACDSAPTAPTSAEAVAGRWQLRSINANGAITSTGGEYVIEFAAPRVSVTSTCALCTGTYSVGSLNTTQLSSSLSISPLACTAIACITSSFSDSFLRLVQTSHTAIATPTALRLSSPEAELFFEKR
jgi:hypothetical protein